MTTAVATLRPRASLALPELSADLSSAIDGAIPRSYAVAADAEAPLVLAPRPVSDRVRAEAQAALEWMLAQPRITQPFMREWLRAILSANLGGAPDTDDALSAVAAASALVCADLPAAALSDAAARRGLAEWEWWPAPAKVRRVVEATASPWLALGRALRAVANSRPPHTTEAAGPHQAPTTEARNAVSALIGSLRDEISAREAAEKAERAPIRPSKPIHPDVLRAMRDGNPLVKAARAARDAGAPD